MSMKDFVMEKTSISLMVLTKFFCASQLVHARDTKYLLSIATALEMKDAEEKLDGSIKFFFGDQETPKILTKLGSDVSNRKTNGLEVR